MRWFRQDEIWTRYDSRYTHVMTHVHTERAATGKSQDETARALPQSRSERKKKAAPAASRQLVGRREEEVFE